MLVEGGRGMIFLWEPLKEDAHRWCTKAHSLIHDALLTFCDACRDEHRLFLLRLTEEKRLLPFEEPAVSPVTDNGQKQRGREKSSFAIAVEMDGILRPDRRIPNTGGQGLFNQELRCAEEVDAWLEAAVGGSARTHVQDSV